MVGGMIHHMKQHLPHDEGFVFFRFLYRLGKQHVILQPNQIGVGLLLYCIPVRTNSLPIIKISRKERFERLNSAQFAEPDILRIHEMDDLFANRSARIFNRL